MRWLLVACLVASCGKGGVEIVVEGQSGEVNKVYLYVGVGDAYTEAIKTQRRALPFPKSDAFARDAYNELDVRDVTPGEPVMFQFQGADKLGVVIAIAANGDTPISAGVLRAVEIPSDYVARYTIKLESLNTAGNPSPLELDVWSPSPGSPKADKVCVALYDKRTSAADAVVTDGDPDCDGWPTGDPKECQPNLYMSYKRPALADAACLLAEMTPDNNVAGCVLGGPACADGHGRETSCNAPTPYCTPLSVCNKCKSTPDPWKCALDVTPLEATAGYPTHLHCKVFFDLTGSMCTSSFKAIAMPSNNIGGHYCKTGGEYPPRIASAGHTWAQSITFPDINGQFTATLKNLEPNCNFEIVPSGFIESRRSFGAIVAGLLDNGRGIAIPIVFEVDPQNVGCEYQLPCQASWSWDLSELVDQCVNTPVFPP